MHVYIYSLNVISQLVLVFILDLVKSVLYIYIYMCFNHGDFCSRSKMRV